MQLELRVCIEEYYFRNCDQDVPDILLLVESLAHDQDVS